MKLIILALTILVIVGCNKPLDPISYLACEQDYQKADKIYVMTDTDKDFVMVQFGNAFMTEWELFDIVYSNVSTTDNLFKFNYEFSAKQKAYPNAEIVYKAYWNAEVDRYLLTLKIDGKRSSIVEYEGELKETPGEIYQDTLQCEEMDVNI
ncbi:hypothetical protein OAR13_02060 [Gammaproteobacteria bacterium]|nr:hypothetical protein [Gammaproteobacteria bacterium]